MSFNLLSDVWVMLKCSGDNVSVFLHVQHPSVVDLDRLLVSMAACLVVCTRPFG